MADIKNLVVSNVIPLASKITEHKLNGSNYYDWRRTILFYLRSTDMDDHMTEDPPKDAKQKKDWLRDDARLYLQIKNSIESEIIGLVDHCESVKELLEFLDFLYSGKEQVHRMFEVCMQFFRAEQKAESVTSYFMRLKKIIAELGLLLPFSPDVKVQQVQREKMAVMIFLNGLLPEFGMAKTQILSDSKIPSLDDAFTRVLRIESSPTSVSIPQPSSALFSKNNNPRAPQRNSTDHRKPESVEIVCNYCRKPGHMKRDCRKLLYKNSQRSQHAQIASTCDIPEASVTISADEFAKFQNYQESLQASSSSTPIASTVAPGNIKCLLTSSTKWVIDSGATAHMTGNSHLFSRPLSPAPFPSVTLADGSTSSVLGSGTIHLTPSFSLSSVLHLPNLSFNLISTSQLTHDLNCVVMFFSGYCLFQDRVTKKIIGRGYESGGLYLFDHQVSQAVACPVVPSPFEVHCRLGHPSLFVLKKLYPEFRSLSSLNCDSCQFAKFHRLSSSPRVDKRAIAPFELVHSDIWGPCPVVSQTGFRYFVTFVDDHSRLTWLYLMKNRSELLSHFCAFHTEIKNQFNVSIKTLRTDNAGEYFSHSLGSYLCENGIIHQSSCADTPSQNGVAERKNRHLLETARALSFQMHVSKIFWVDAVSTACFLINRMPSSVLNGEIPYRVLFPTKHLFPIAPKIFGCVCFVRDVRPHHTKLDPKSLKCIFLGYSRVQKGYRCYCPTLKRYLVSPDVVFFEDTPFTSSPSSLCQGEDDNLFIYEVTSPTPSLSTDVPPSRPLISQVYSRRPPPQPSDSCPPSMLPSSCDPAPSDDLPIALRKGKRKCTYPVSSFISYHQLSPSTYAFITSLESTSIPNSVHEALSHPGWQNAMIEEMTALDDNGTWDLVSRPAGKKAIGCKWVFAVKMNPDGTVARLKARLVAKGYAQIYGTDYSDTFSPVAKLTSIRLFLSMAATNKWSLHQLDIKNAFLHGDLQEEVYMEQPPGFVAQGESDKVCRLRKSLYGLKQSPRAWFGKFSQALVCFGMKKSTSDHSVFYRRSEKGIVLLVVYVDDIVITGNDVLGISSLKTFLQGQFYTKDLGQLKYFLGIEVMRSKKGIYLSQRKYVLDLLSETGKLGAKPSGTPMMPNQQLVKEGELCKDPERYRRLVGKLNYLTVTRPDIAYSVSVVSQFMSSPTVDHWAAVEQILCYLKAAPGRGILYKDHGHTRVECFSDADWAGSREDRRSTSGYCVFVGGNLVSWKSKKQNVVSRSSAESEYRAMAQSVCEIVWIHQLLSEIGFSITVPAKLWCDNQAALHIASNPVFHERTKHIEVDCHFIREKIQDGLVSTGYVKTGEQLGDILTKALNGTRISYLCNKLGMIDIFAPA